MPPVPGLDSDGKVIVKVDKSQVKISKDGTVKIDNDNLKKFLAEKTKAISEDLHIILMGSSCGCQCCC